ncbi:DUF1450 domain-containing protein [Trichlorobacter ammonificans]|uniref:DUF1450 domain-containing protein n=1 Tax=Trichlorobacter ammonificans TaxID=2916410 RepID=A0ABM9D6Z3_9BACT|nr:DUF1450 domain-containing protein [Trichlorobacter ammonificans]CAH2030784.1 conserved protein of unknown function [Trichlorobacter ammonificans]
MKVRLCNKSPKGKNRFARELKEKIPGIDVKVRGCLKQCGTCRERPFALLDGHRVISAETWEELGQRLAAYQDEA